MKSKRSNQYLGSFCMLLNLVVCGTTLGWNSPSFPVLMSAEATPLSSGPLTLDQISWISALLAPGGLAGTFFYGWMLEKFSRRTCAFSIGILHLISWLLTVFATNYYYIYVSKFVSGVSGCGSFIISAAFISEVAEVSIRGFLGSFIYLSYNFGVLLAFILGGFIHCMTTPWIYIALDLFYIGSVYFLPDTPFYYAKQGMIKQAEESLRFYRGLPKGEKSELIEKEIMELTIDKTDSDSDAGETNLDYTDRKAAIRSSFLGAILFLLYGFCGCFAMLNYTTQIFEQAGSNLTPSDSTMIVGLIQLVGTYASTVLIEVAGRKVLLISSALGTAAGQIVFGTYVYCSQFMDLKSLNWIPLISFSFVIFIANCGVLNLPFLLLSELLPVKIRSMVTTLCYAIMYTGVFAVLKFLPFIMETLGFHVAMYMFSLICVISAIYFAISLPETKGKTLAEIQDRLSK